MITKQQWQIDKVNTERELSAYKMMADGCQILSSLPEHSPAKRAGYEVQATNYRRLYQECLDFLNKLNSYGRYHFPEETGPLPFTAENGDCSFMENGDLR